MNLGSLHKRLRLQCKPCGWVAPESITMEAVQLHFQVDHDTSDVTLDLVPACRCGEAMTHAESVTVRGEITDFFRCGVCGNTGYVNRKDVKP
jgi:hypothetical protein